nr:prolyl oligopeptidase family serine peptidase [Cytophagales bacterium]
MRKNRRFFLKVSSLLGMSFIFKPGITSSAKEGFPENLMNEVADELATEDKPVIGAYGNWASGLLEKALPSHSFRRKEWKNVAKWKREATNRLKDRIAPPDLGGVPLFTIDKQYEYDGLHIEEISWQLPTGGRSEGILLKPQGATGRLPGILAFHDHGGWKYFGKRKITKTGPDQHPMMVDHQRLYYGGLGWANEAAKRGYVVFVPDAFPFASRRVRLMDVPERLRQGLTDSNPDLPENAKAYNEWAKGQADTMAKSLFSAGTTWPGVFFAEDQKALDLLSSREDVDADRIGCGGLSGGGMRTVFMGGLDPRIKCAVCVGFMTTWKDMVLHKSFTHTWMAFVPVLPKEMDFPEILGLRVPLPTMVINSNEDGLYTLSEMKEAERILAEVYEKANAKENYRCDFFPGGHQFDKEMQTAAFDWFDQWLKS